MRDPHIAAGAPRAARPTRHVARAALAAACALLACVGSTSLAAAARAGRVARVDGAALAARHGFAFDEVGYVLFDAASGEVLDEHQADGSFIPASTTKVATALAALEVLGGDFRFATTLLATGPIRDGTVAGDLYLRGGGDPTLTSDDLRAMARELRARGATRVAGRFLFDDGLFPRSTEIDLLQPEAASYNPAVSALSVNYNRLVLRWRRTGKHGSFATTLVSPADGGAVAVPGIGTGTLSANLDPRIQLVLAREPSPRWLLSPRLPAKGAIDVPLKPDPARAAAAIFAALAREAGVRLPEPRRGTVPDDARVLVREESDPLVVVVEGLLRYSNNLTAELVGLATSRQLTGTGLALGPSAARVTAWWRDRLPETSFAGFFAANHSGLSSRTRHSPRQLAAILRHGRASLRDLLAPWRGAPDDARSGEEGRGRVRAKSGTLLYGDGLVGYLERPDGRVLGFAILLSDLDARSRLDATRDVRITASPPAATEWTNRAKALERELVLRWLAGAS